MAVIQVVLTNGTTADANQVMQNFNEIYGNIDETNIQPANKTGSGKIVLQTSPALTTPTITGGTITGATFPSPTFTGTVNLNSNTGFNIFSDAGTTLKFKVNGATGDTGIVSGAKLFLDTADLTGNDFWINSANGQNDLYSNGILALRTNSGGQVLFPQGANVSAGSPFVLDGFTGNDYWVNSANGQNDLYAAGVLAIRTHSSGGVSIGNDLDISPNSKFLLDNSAGNDYWTNSADGQNDLYCAGTLALRTTSAGLVSFQQGTIFNSKPLYLNTNGDTNNQLYFDGSNTALNTTGNLNLSAHSGANYLQIASTQSTFNIGLLQFEYGIGSYRIQSSVSLNLFSIQRNTGGGIYVNQFDVSTVHQGLGAGTGDYFYFQGYNAGAPGITGYVTIVFNGVPYKVSVHN